MKRFNLLAFVGVRLAECLRAAKATRIMLFDDSEHVDLLASDVLATSLATNPVATKSPVPVIRPWVGRPGLDPDTLGSAQECPELAVTIRLRRSAQLLVRSFSKTSDSNDGKFVQIDMVVVLSDEGHVQRHCGCRYPRVIHRHALTGVSQQHPQPRPLFGNVVVDRNGIERHDRRQCRQAQSADLDVAGGEHTGP